MRVPDSTLIVSAIFQVAETTGNEKVTPGMVTTFLTQQFKLNLPLHTVSEIMRDLGIVTHTVQNNRYIIWNNESMQELHENHIGKFKQNNAEET